MESKKKSFTQGSASSSTTSNYGNAQNPRQAHIEAEVQKMWNEVILKEIEESNNDFKQLSELPIARIKKIVAADDDVRMVSAEVPIIFARACRMFIMEVSLRAYLESVSTNRKTVQKEDIHTAVKQMESFDFFLKDVFDGTIQKERESRNQSQQ